MTKKAKLLALLGILIFILLNYPLMHIFNHDTLVGGLPVLVLYLHGVWILAIAGLYGLSRRLTAEQPGRLESDADVK